MKVGKKSLVAMLLATSIVAQPVAAVKAEKSNRIENLSQINNISEEDLFGILDNITEDEYLEAIEDFFNSITDSSNNVTMGIIKELARKAGNLNKLYEELKNNPIVENSLAGNAAIAELERYGQVLDTSIQNSEAIIKASRDLLKAFNDFVDGLTEESYDRLGFGRDFIINIIKANVKAITDNVIHILDETLEGMYALKLKYDVAMAVYKPELQTYENVNRIVEARDSLSRDPRIVFGKITSDALDNLVRNLRKTGKYLNEMIEYHFREYENVIGFHIPTREIVEDAQSIYNNLSDKEKAKVDEELYERVLLALDRFEQDIDQSLEEQRQIVNFLSEMRELEANNNKKLNELSLAESQVLFDSYNSFNARQRKIVRVTGIKDPIYGKGHLKGMADTIDLFLVKHEDLSVEDYLVKLEEIKGSGDLEKQFKLIKEFALKETKMQPAVRARVEQAVRDLAYRFNEKIVEEVNIYNKTYENAVKKDDLSIEEMEKLIADMENMPEIIKNGYNDQNKPIKVRDITIKFNGFNKSNIKDVEEKIAKVKEEVKSFDEKTIKLLENDKASEFEIKYHLKAYQDLNNSVKKSVNKDNIKKLEDKLKDLPTEQSNPSRVLKYSVGAKVRDEKGNYIGYLEKGQAVEGVVDGKTFRFTYKGTKATAHTAFLRDSMPESVYYVRQGSNVRARATTSSAVISYAQKGTKVTGVKQGAWTKVKVNGKSGYIASNRLTTNNLSKKYISSGVNVRDTSGNKIGYIKAGDVVSGVLEGNNINFVYRGTPARVHIAFVK